MTIPYLGDFAEDATVYIPFNTFDSNDPSASVTVTNLADADIKVHKDGSVLQIVTDGATVATNFDSITGNHLITIDTSAHADYAIGSDYMVRVEGITVDGATLNVWLAQFSIENRYPAATINTVLTDTEALLVDTEATIVDTEAIIVDTEAAAPVLADTEAILTDSEAINTATAATLVDTEAAITERSTLLTDTEAILLDTGTTLLADTEAILADTEASADPWLTALPGAYGAGTAGNIVGNNLDAATSTVVTDTEAILTDTEAVNTATAATLVDTEAAITERSTLLTDTEAILADTEALGVGSGLTALATGTAQSGTASTIVLAAAASFADNVLNGNIIKIHTGTGAGQSRLILSNTLADDTCNITPNWATNPDATSQYEIVEGAANVTAVSLTAQTAGDIIADTEAVLADTEAAAGVITDTEAILTDTEAAITERSTILTDTELAAGNSTTILADTELVLTDTEAAITERSTLLTDTEAVLTDVEAAVTERATILTDTEAVLADTEAIEPRVGLAVTVTFSAGGTTTTAVFNQVDGAAASSTDDVYNGGVLVFTAPAALKDQRTDITDYVGATTTATITAVTASVGATATAYLV